MEQIGIVIQARMGSSRFPGKVLADFCGVPMLLFQVERLRHMVLGMPIVIATSENTTDDAIETLCHENGIDCFRGDEEDVFGRFAAVAERFGFVHLVRLTGDNPLPQERVIKAALSAHLRSGADLTSTRRVLSDRSIERFVPAGCSVDVINASSLLSVDRTQLDLFQREHVIPVFFEGDFKVEVLESIPGFKAPSVDLSVDTMQDLARVVQYYTKVMGSSAL